MNAIKDMRRKLSITQYDIAKYLGVSRSAIQQYERGSKSPSTEVLLRLSKLEMMLAEGELERKTKLEAEDKLMAEHYEKSRDNPDIQLRIHASRTAKLYRAYAAMQKKYRDAEHQLSIARKLNEQTEQGRNKENVFLNLLEANLLTKITANDKWEQLKLRAKILGRIREYEVLSEGIGG